MLTTIYLFGELGQKFGRKWKLAVSSTAEAVRLIEANAPGFVDYLATAEERGIAFKVKVDGEVIGPERLRFQRAGSVIRISPVAAGAKSGSTQAIIGVVLVIAAIAAQQYHLLPGILSGTGTAAAGGAAAGLFGGYIGTAVGAMGVAMAIGGVAAMIAGSPAIGGTTDTSKPSYLFSGPVNTVGQGGPVPLCYGGPIIVGSSVISAGVYSEDISAVQRGVIQEGSFTEDPDYPVYSAPVTPTNLKGRSIQTKQVVRILDAICDGKIAGLCDSAGNILSYDDRNKGILFESTQTVADDGTAAFNEFSTAFRPGSVTQTPIPGFPSAESETSVETEVIKGSDKVANAVQRTIAAGSHKAVRVSIRIPALYRYDDKGNRTGASVHFGIHLKRSADSIWTEVVGSNALPNGELDGLIQGEATESAAIAFRIPLPGVGPWDLRVLKESPDAADPTKEQSKCVWASYALLTDGRFTYRHTAIVGSEFPADKFQSAPNRWFRIKGRLIRVPSNYNPVTRNYTGTWDGKFSGADLTLSANYTAGDATLSVDAIDSDLSIDSPIEIQQGGITSHAYLLAAATAGATSLSITPINRALTAGATGYGFELKWTNNPAWILYDVLIEKRFGLGDYIPRTHVDTAALYTIARYCDGVDGSGNFVGVDDGRGGVEPRFALTTCISGAQDAYKMLSDIAGAFRGMIYYGAGLISAVQDSPKEPRFNFHDGNVIEGEFQYSNTDLKSRHTRVRVQFADPDNFYKSDVEPVDASDEDLDLYGIRETSVTAFGCCSRGQARRLGNWILLTEKKEKKASNFRTGMQGARVRPGDIVRVRDRSKTVNVMAGRIISIGAGTLTLDAEVTLGVGASYTLIVTKTDGTFAELPVTTGAGTTATLAVTGSLTGIDPFTDWILRTPSLEPVLFRVLNAREVERHIFELVGLRYASEKFAEVETGIVIPAAPTSDLPRPEIPVSPASITIEESAVDTASGTQRFLTCTWERSVSNYVDSYIVEYRSPDGEWREVENRAKGTSAKPVLVTALGEHSFRVFAVNKLGFVSTPGAALSYTLAEVDIPDAPTDLAATAQTDGIFLVWTNPDSSNLTVIEIQESLDATFNDPPDATDPIIGTAPADTDVRGSFHRGGITSSRHRWYRIRAKNKSGGRSTWTSSVDATAIVAPTGPTGASGDSVFIEYSVDGATSWHSTYTSGDLYMRQKIGTGGTWSAAIPIVGTNGAAGVRGSKSFYATTTGTSWSNTEADAAITAASLTKVLLDTVTLSKASAGYSETRYWDGSNWTVVAQVIDGNLIVHGTIGTNHLVASISLTTPTILGGLLKLNGASTVCANTADGSDNSIVRLNGGGADGQDRGGQVDVLGNEYTAVAGYGGSVLITPGNHADGTVRLRDRTGVDRLWISSAGKVNIANGLELTGQANFYNGAYFAGTASFGSSVSAAGAVQAGTEMYAFGAGADRVGFLNAAGASGGDVFVGLRYDAGNHRAELAALEGGVAWRDVVIAPNAYAAFGVHSALGSETVTGFITVKDTAGNLRKLAVLS